MQENVGGYSGVLCLRLCDGLHALCIRDENSGNDYTRPLRIVQSNPLPILFGIVQMHHGRSPNHFVEIYRSADTDRSKPERSINLVDRLNPTTTLD